MRHFYRQYSPAWDLANRRRNRFDVESYDVYEFHGDNNGDPDSGASDDQTSVSGAAGASVSLPDCAPDDPACHPHSAFKSFPYPGYGPSVPPGYPHGPFVDPEMGYDGAPPPPGAYGRPEAPRGYGGRPGAPRERRGIVERLLGRPASPQQRGPELNTWERWRQIHPDSSLNDYLGWQNMYGQYGASINGESDDSLGDADLCGGLDMRG